MNCSPRWRNLRGSRRSSACSAPSVRERLDTRLVAQGLAPSREKAKRLILAGAVRVNGQLAAKAGDLVEEDAALQIEAPEKYVSRGGYKLEAALEAFHIDCGG